MFRRKFLTRSISLQQFLIRQRYKKERINAGLGKASGSASEEEKSHKIEDCGSSKYIMNVMSCKTVVENNLPLQDVDALPIATLLKDKSPSTELIDQINSTMMLFQNAMAYNKSSLLPSKCDSIDSPVAISEKENVFLANSKDDAHNSALLLNSTDLAKHSFSKECCEQNPVESCGNRLNNHTFDPAKRHIKPPTVIDDASPKRSRLSEEKPGNNEFSEQCPAQQDLKDALSDSLNTDFENTLNDNPIDSTGQPPNCSSMASIKMPDVENNFIPSDNVIVEKAYGFEESDNGFDDASPDKMDFAQKDPFSNEVAELLSVEDYSRMERVNSVGNNSDSLDQMPKITEEFHSINKSDVFDSKSIIEVKFRNPGDLRTNIDSHAEDLTNLTLHSYQILVDESKLKLGDEENLEDDNFKHNNNAIDHICSMDGEVLKPVTCNLAQHNLKLENIAVFASQLIEICIELENILSIKNIKEIFENIISKNMEMNSQNILNTERYCFELKKIEDFFKKCTDRSMKEMEFNFAKFNLQIQQIWMHFDQVEDLVTLITNVHRQLYKDIQLRTNNQHFLQNEIDTLKESVSVLKNERVLQNMLIDNLKNDKNSKEILIDTLTREKEDALEQVFLKNGDLEDFKIIETNLRNENKINLESLEFLTKENSLLIKEKQCLESKISHRKIELDMYSLQYKRILSEVDKIKNIGMVIKRNYLCLLENTRVEFENVREIIQRLSTIFSEIGNNYELKLAEAETQRIDDIRRLNQIIDKVMDEKAATESTYKAKEVEYGKLSQLTSDLKVEIDLKNKYIFDLEANMVELQKNTEFYQKQLLESDLTIQELKSNKINVDASLEISKIRKKYIKEIAALKLRIEELEMGSE